MPTRPLNIWVAEEYMTHPKIAEAIEKGHCVYTVESVCSYGASFDGKTLLPDLILHPNAWNWHEGMWDYLDVAIKQAREVKYGKNEGTTKPATKRKTKGA